jgi:hypothetical protein
MTLGSEVVRLIKPLPFLPDGGTTCTPLKDFLRPLSVYISVEIYRKILGEWISLLSVPSSHDPNRS